MQSTIHNIPRAGRLIPAEYAVVAQLPSFRSSMRHAVSNSGLTQEVIASDCRMDYASFSRSLCEPMRENSRPREFPHDRLERFMRLTKSLAPLQWHAYQVGMELVGLDEALRFRKWADQCLRSADPENIQRPLIAEVA